MGTRTASGDLDELGAWASVPATWKSVTIIGRPFQTGPFKTVLEISTITFTDGLVIKPDTVSRSPLVTAVQWSSILNPVGHQCEKFANNSSIPKRKKGHIKPIKKRILVPINPHPACRSYPIVNFSSFPAIQKVTRKPERQNQADQNQKFRRM